MLLSELLLQLSKLGTIVLFVKVNGFVTNLIYCVMVDRAILDEPNFTLCEPVVT